MQKSSKVLNIIIGVLYALLGIIWLISGISSLGNMQILLGTNILTYVCLFLPVLVVFAIIGISLYRLKKNESTGLIALLWVIASVIMFFVGIVLYKQYTSDGTNIVLYAGILFCGSRVDCSWWNYYYDINSNKEENRALN